MFGKVRNLLKHGDVPTAEGPVWNVARNGLPSWEEQSSLILDRIRDTPAPLKIVVKTKDDLRQLKSWVQHHAALVGYENLIFFDNGSTDREMLDYLHSLHHSSVVCTFDGYMNTLHVMWAFKPLYEALMASSKAYTFIDTDERLYWMRDAETLVPSEQFTECVISADFGSDHVLPGLWLDCEPGRADLFRMFEVGKGVPKGIPGGKPVVSSDMPLQKFLNHNFQLHFDDPAGIGSFNLLVVHLKFLWPGERAKVNIEKMKKYGVVDSDLNFEDAIDLLATKLDAGELNGNPEAWVNEILYLERDLRNDDPNFLSDGQVKLNGLQLTYAHPHEKAAVQHLLDNPGEVFAKAFDAKMKQQEAKAKQEKKPD